MALIMTAIELAKAWSSLSKAYGPSDIAALCDEQPLKDRTMAVMFCDITGSTQALRRLRTDHFQQLQKHLFSAICVSAEALSKDPHAPKIVVDKFMGDGGMFYVDCTPPGDKPTEAKEPPSMAVRRSQAATQIMRFVDGITEIFESLRNAPEPSRETGGQAGSEVKAKGNSAQELKEISAELRRREVKIGARFGLALGNGIVLSLLGAPDAALSLTLTGETVNLAARLEHATTGEFLESIASARRNLQAYTNHLTDPQKLHGTALAKGLAECDRHVLDLHSVCECRYQVRADNNFVQALAQPRGGSTEQTQVAWKKMPFAPRGFGEVRTAWLLGGNSSAELFRRV